MNKTIAQYPNFFQDHQADRIISVSIRSLSTIQLPHGPEISRPGDGF